MRAVMVLAVMLLSCSELFAQCPGGNCGAWRQVRYYSVPQPQQYVYQQPVYSPPPQMGVSLPNPLMRPRRTEPVLQQQPVYHRPAPQQPVTARVYVSGSYNHNGSGIPLDAHLAQEHGINAVGLNAAQQEAEHVRAHAAQARWGYNGYSASNTGRRGGILRRLFQ